MQNQNSNVQPTSESLPIGNANVSGWPNRQNAVINYLLKEAEHFIEQAKMNVRDSEEEAFNHNLKMAINRLRACR